MWRLVVACLCFILTEGTIVPRGFFWGEVWNEERADFPFSEFRMHLRVNDENNADLAVKTIVKSDNRKIEFKRECMQLPFVKEGLIIHIEADCLTELVNDLNDMIGWEFVKDRLTLVVNIGRYLSVDSSFFGIAFPLHLKVDVGHVGEFRDRPTQPRGAHGRRIHNVVDDFMNLAVRRPKRRFIL